MPELGILQVLSSYPSWPQCSRKDEGPGFLLSASPFLSLIAEQTGAAPRFISTGSITVISKDINVSDKSHWKENSSRLTIN